MKLKNILAVGAVLIMTSGIAKAAHIWEDPNSWWSGHFSYETGPRYTAGEFSLEGFGSYMAAERKIGDLFETNIRHGEWGGGVGLNYFFTREIGIGSDINIGDNRGHFVDHVMGNLYARFPIEPSGFAPYVFGGGGRSTDQIWEWLLHAGIGIEYRFNPITGIFFDTRYIWHTKDGSTDRLQFRAGLRLAF
jgi:hypothetical protein